MKAFLTCGLFLFVFLACNQNQNGKNKVESTIDETNYDGSEGEKKSADKTPSTVEETSYHQDYKGLSITGHFRYMADAASFTPCNDTKNYEVMMSGEEYQKTERSYLNAVEKGGDEAFIEVLGKWEEMANMEDRIVKTLVIHQLIELNPYRDCE